jgi:hypothetical protein
MTTALDRWDAEGGAQDVAWPLPYEGSDCGTWSVESWSVWVPPLSPNGTIYLPTFSAGSSSRRRRASRTTPRC